MHLAELDFVVTVGMIFDGTGAPRYRADIGIRDRAIAEIDGIPVGEQLGRRVVASRPEPCQRSSAGVAQGQIGAAWSLVSTGANPAGRPCTSRDVTAGGSMCRLE
jgi:hypothetical protein